MLARPILANTSYHTNATSCATPCPALQNTTVPRVKIKHSYTQAQSVVTCSLLIIRRLRHSLSRFPQGNLVYVILRTWYVIHMSRLAVRVGAKRSLYLNHQDLVWLALGQFANCCEIAPKKVNRIELGLCKTYADGNAKFKSFFEYIALKKQPKKLSYRRCGGEREKCLIFVSFFPQRLQAAQFVFSGCKLSTR